MANQAVIVAHQSLKHGAKKAGVALMTIISVDDP